MSPEKNQKEIIKDISLLSGKPQYTVEHILHYVFGTIRDGIKSGKLESYRVKGLFSIVVKPKRKPYAKKGLEEYRKRKQARRDAKANNTEIKQHIGGMEISDMGEQGSGGNG